MIRGMYFMRRIKNEEIRFVDDRWRRSFERHVAQAREFPHYQARIEFAELWMKVMQLQTRSGILDPDTSFWRVTEIMGYRPSIEEIAFMRGLIGSHWEYGEYFVHYTSGYKEDVVAERARFKENFFMPTKK